MTKDIFDGRLVPIGENPRGFTAVTPNGVSHDKGDGMNHDMNWGPSINGRPWCMPEDGTILGGAMVTGLDAIGGTKRTPAQKNRNRTGE